MKDQKITAFGHAHTYVETKMQIDDQTDAAMVRKVSKLDQRGFDGVTLRTDLYLLGIGLFAFLILLITGQ